MPELIIDGCEQVTIRGDAGDGPFANVFSFDTGSSTGDARTVAQAVLDHYVDDLLPVLCQTVKVTDAYFIDLSSSAGDTGTVTYSGSGDLVGGVTAPACPPHIGYLVKLVTGGGRGSHNGRKFLPGVREDEVDAHGDISAVTRFTVQTAFGTFGSNIAADVSAAMSVVHRNISGPGALSPIVGVDVATPVGTIKRRLHR